MKMSWIREKTFVIFFALNQNLDETEGHFYIPELSFFTTYFGQLRQQFNCAVQHSFLRRQLSG